jgi:pyrroline-5-carboxylate reductase
MRGVLSLQFTEGVGVGQGVEREVLETMVAQMVEGEAAFLQRADDSQASYVPRPASPDVSCGLAMHHTPPRP